jgi:hypothetical protein
MRAQDALRESERSGRSRVYLANGKVGNKSIASLSPCATSQAEGVGRSCGGMVERGRLEALDAGRHPCHDARSAIDGIAGLIAILAPNVGQKKAVVSNRFLDRSAIFPIADVWLRRSKSGKSTLGKTMARDDKKTSPAPKSGAAEKKEVAAKKDEGQPKDKTAPDADRSKAESGEKAASSPSDYSRGEGQKPVSKAYRDNWNAIYAKKEKKKRR